MIPAARNPSFTQSGDQPPGQSVYPPRNTPQPFRAVVDSIHRRHHRQQDLSRTDVRGGLVPTDVLLPGLQGQTQGRAPLSIAGLTDQSTGNLALVRLACGEKCRVRSAETHGDTKALGTSDSDISTHGSHRCHQCLGQWINRHGHQCPDSVAALDQISGIPDSSISARKLQQNSKNALIDADVVGIHLLELNSQGLSTGQQNRPGLGQNRRIDEITRSICSPCDSMAECHGLRSRRGLIQEGGIGDG